MGMSRPKGGKKRGGRKKGRETSCLSGGPSLKKKKKKKKENWAAPTVLLGEKEGRSPYNLASKEGEKGERGGVRTSSGAFHAARLPRKGRKREKSS